MSKPWFHAETGHLLLDEHVMERPSFQKVISDSAITDNELAEHAIHVADLLRRLETDLPAQSRELVRELLCEMAILQALQTKVRQQTVTHW
jgi:hypothetical protein